MQKIMLIFSLVLVLVSCAVTVPQEDKYYRLKRVSSFDGANQLLNYQLYQYADGNARSDSYDSSSNLTSYNIYLFNSNGLRIAESNYNADGTLIDFHIIKYDLSNRYIVLENYNANGQIDYYTSNEYYNSRRVIVFYRNGVPYSSNVYELRTNSNQPLKRDSCSYNSCGTVSTFEYDSANRFIRENFLLNTNGDLSSYYIYEYGANSDNPGVVRRNSYLTNGVLSVYGTFEYESYFSPTVVPPRSIFRGFFY